MRRASVFVSILAVVALSLIALGRTEQTAAQDATPMVDGHGLVGSWQTTVTFPEGPPSASVGTLAIDGTIVVSLLPVQPLLGAPGGVIHMSSLHGAWQATGPDTAIATFVGLVSDGQGNASGTVSVRASITLAPEGQSFSGANTVTIADATGNTVANRHGTVQATRIVAEGPEMPTAGTPTA